MKHAGNGSSLDPAREQARAANRARGIPPRTTSPSPRTSTRWIGPWQLDVTDTGDLVAIHEDTGVVRLLAANDREG